MAIAALGCDRPELIPLPQGSVLQIPADAGMEDVNALMHTEGLLYLSGEGADGSPSIIAIEAGGRVRTVRTFAGTKRCELVSGSATRGATGWACRADRVCAKNPQPDKPIATRVVKSRRIER